MGIFAVFLDFRQLGTQFFVQMERIFVEIVGGMW